uniref:Helitron_like_N domain-containing protein n=1 Tax=Caenorhabditis tropicalis TaxID=1561998 RepID=A0A1I7UWB0_9PELO
MLDQKFKGKKKLGMLVTMPSTVPGTSKYQKELVMSAVTISNTLGNPHLFITFTGNPMWPEIKRECAANKCDWSDIPEVVNRVFILKTRVYRQSSCLPDLWVHGTDHLCTTDQYVAAFMESRGLLEKSLPDPTDAPDNSNKDHSSISDVLFTSYPQTVFLESRNDPCPFCGALAFPSERLRSCCKNGAVYVDPIKTSPESLKNIFQGKFGKWLIASNAAFSMASISYTRQNQKAHGVNSMKIKGVVSFHPSALHSNDPQEPRYANFICSECTNKALKRVFDGIQDYLNANNTLYCCYKSMSELEEEYLKDCDEPDSTSDALKFRIVSPTELNEKDAKALAHHEGVYAKPNRMGRGYITVAFTFNSDSSVPIPR